MAQVVDRNFSGWKGDVQETVAACVGAFTDGIVSTTTMGSIPQTTQADTSASGSPTKLVSSALSDCLGGLSLTSIWLSVALPALGCRSLLPLQI